jgi:hypothetical protein
LQPSANDFGTKVASYKLFIDLESDDASTFTQVVSYSAFLPQFTLTALNSILGTAGETYRVKIQSVNALGLLSEFSNELLFALGSVPS